MNQWIVRGRISKNVEIKTYNQTKMAMVCLAVNNFYNQKTDFFEFKVFGKLVDVFEKINVGTHLLVTAHIHNNHYEDVETGKKVYGKDQYVIQSIEFLDSKSKEIDTQELEQELFDNNEQQIDISETATLGDEDGIY